MKARGDDMDIETKIVDTATPFLRYLADSFPKEFDRALKSTGWWLREDIKAGIRAEAPGGQPYKPYSSITKSRILDSMRGRKKGKRGKYLKPRILRAAHKPMGRLYSATRYQFYGDSRRVIIGWISKSAERLGTLQEKGGTIKITPKMRRFFWAAGIPLSKGRQTLRIPARPTIDPEYRENAPKVPGYIENKIWDYIKRAEKK